jgi:hypothetical protein
MNEYINVNKSKFGEDMIKYYEMKNVLQMFDAYNKNDLKIKTIILTDDAILEMNNLIKEEKEIILDKSVFKIDKVIRKNINPLTSNYIIMLKLVNLDIVTTKDISTYFIIKEADIYLKEFTKKNINITLKIVRDLLKSNLNEIKRVFDITKVKDYDITSVNEYTYKLTKIK